MESDGAPKSVDAPRVRGTDRWIVVPELSLEQKTAGRFVAARGLGAAATATQGGFGRAGFKGAGEGNLDSSAEGDDSE